MKEHYKGIGHIAIYTVDMDQSIAFYEMIGGSVFKRDGVETPEGLKKLALVEFGGFLQAAIIGRRHHVVARRHARAVRRGQHPALCRLR